MPITRRRRANPPDEPENNNHFADQTNDATESLAADQASMASVDGDSVGSQNAERPEHTPLPPFAPSTLV